MSEYRQDPLSRRWVIVGCDERATRPSEFVEATVRQSGVTCPFCAGNARPDRFLFGDRTGWVAGPRCAQ
jgi:galactose-1-phosphate uridylyltransferase